MNWFEFFRSWSTTIDNINIIRYNVNIYSITKYFMESNLDSVQELVLDVPPEVSSEVVRNALVKLFGHSVGSSSSYDGVTKFLYLERQGERVTNTMTGGADNARTISDIKGVLSPLGVTIE